MCTETLKQMLADIKKDLHNFKSKRVLSSFRAVTNTFKNPTGANVIRA